MKNLSVSKYDEAKAVIKAEMEHEGKKYPTNKNELSDSFICDIFAPKLELEDIIKLRDKRKELKAKAEAPAEGESAKVGNWFPAFRSWVGATFFPEFDAKKAPKKGEDKHGKSLDELIAAMSKANS